MAELNLQDIYNILLFAALIITLIMNIRSLTSCDKKKQEAMAEERAEVRMRLESLEKSLLEIRKAVIGPPPISQDIELIKTQLSDINRRLDRLEKRED